MNPRTKIIGEWCSSSPQKLGVYGADTNKRANVRFIFLCPWRQSQPSYSEAIY